MQPLSPEDIRYRFDFHPAVTETRRKYHENIRDLCRRTALTLASNLPAGRELSLAITKLEEVMFWANAALARSEDPDAGHAVIVTAQQKGQRAYEAYGAATGGKTFDGRDMPHWQDLGETIQAAWVAAATCQGD